MKYPFFSICTESLASGACAAAEYRRNLEYFVEMAVRENDGCHYIIVVQQVTLS